jgi:hypothetical protein
MKTHFAVQQKNSFGGHTTHTLCGRDSSESRDGFNSCEHLEKVDCALCKNILENKKHWRNRKYLATEDQPK